MAFTFGFYDSVDNDRKYNAVQLSSMFDGVIADGVYANIGSRLMVSFVEGMTFAIGTGRAWFNHTWTLNDTPIQVILNVGHPLYPRIDTIVLKIDQSLPMRQNTVYVHPGIAAASPVPATLTNTSEIHEYPLAYITVPANANLLNGTYIQNKVGTAECPFVTGIIDTINTSDLLVQWNEQFTVWFDNVKGQLGTDPAGNLQNQIDAMWVPHISEGRLSLSSGNPVPATDVLAATTLYYTGYRGMQVVLYDTVAAKWTPKTLFAEVSGSLSGLLANTIYDVFLYLNGSNVVTMEFVAWTNSTTRAVTLSRLNGILVKSTDSGRRYIGTIRTTGTAGQCEDSVLKRYVWNMYNQVERNLRLNEATSHTHNGTWRDWNNVNTPVSYVQGLRQVVKASARVNMYCSATTGQAMAAIVTNTDSGFAVDTATIGSTVATASSWVNMALTFLGIEGYGSIFPREYVNGGITGTFVQAVIHASQMM